MEAIERGEITRFLANVPPGTMKSMIVSVFFNAWVWGPKGRPNARFLATSHNERNSIRDNLKCRRLIESEWYQRLWGDTVKLTGDQNAKTKFENTATGFREGTPFKSMTGVRADFVILDDPMSVDDAGSDKTRESINLTFHESLPTRLNNPDSSAIIVIMQRLHEEDTSGIILAGDFGYEHLCLPMRFDPGRKCVTSIFEDPRTEDGELLFPERFPDWVVDRDEAIMGPYAAAGQFQQAPSPRGGGIIKREWWQLWENETDKFPSFDYVLASADTAYTEKEENDPTGFTIWGVWRDKTGAPKIMLVHAWRKFLELHGPYVEKYPDETEAAYIKRAQPTWGLVEWLAHSCRRYKADLLLIEGKASGITVSQELRRLHGTEGWGIQLVQPVGDKVSRMHAVQPIFSQELVYAPDREWADMVIEEMSAFPKGRYDDLSDSASQSLKFLREGGFIQHRFERRFEEEEAARHRGGKPAPLYGA
jgi:predicted phage terminase large subunit-like protein